MWLISLRDLEWRRRRFVIAVVATGLVFGITLLLSGMSSGFSNEVDRTVASFGADGWVVPKTASGPFTTSAAFPSSVANDVAQISGVHEASPMVLTRVTVPGSGGTPTDLVVFGTVIHGVGPRATTGRDPRRSGEIVTDTKLGRDVGQTVTIGGKRFTVVGTSDGRTVFAGEPTAVIPIQDARAISFADQPLATAVVTHGAPQGAPAGYRVLTTTQAAADLRRPLKSATGTISFLNVLLWIIAAGIIGSIVYLTVIERTRDFAVLKATGIASGALFLSLAIEAVVIALAAAIVATVIAVGLHSALPMRVEISTTSYGALAIIAVVVGILASLVGLRRAIGVDPALAFG
ncbi:MAG TPA: ABC transporter permease [Acidimicrobiia bacterium]|nr:ABC transporter permease [Acidimicrobiia bacterium]